MKEPEIEHEDWPTMSEAEADMMVSLLMKAQNISPDDCLGIVAVYPMKDGSIRIGGTIDNSGHTAVIQMAALSLPPADKKILDVAAEWSQHHQSKLDDQTTEGTSNDDEEAN